MKKTVIIPTYNERENIAELIKRILVFVPDINIVVVDDNSPDGTAEELKRLKEKFPGLSLLFRERKRGLGTAYLHAFKKILEDDSVSRIVLMDADFSHDPKELPRMLKESEYCGVVLGSRYISGGRTEGWELWRKILSRGGNFYCRTITGMPIFDCTTGFMAVDVNFLKKIDFLKIDLAGFAFLMELKYLLWKAGASFKEIPIVFKDRVAGKSKISNHIIREGALAPWKMIIKRKF